MIKVFFFIILSLSFLSINAQNKPDSAKIISYEEQMMVRINMDTNVEDFIANYKSEGENLQTRLSLTIKSELLFLLITK